MEKIQLLSFQDLRRKCWATLLLLGEMVAPPVGSFQGIPPPSNLQLIFILNSRHRFCIPKTGDGSWRQNSGDGDGLYLREWDQDRFVGSILFAFGIIDLAAMNSSGLPTISK